MHTRLPLTSGTSIPILGFGVYKIPEGKECEEAVGAALKAGYRHIDTAKYYGNEASVGRAVRASGIPRKEIFITTKLWVTDYLRPEHGFDESFKKLDLGYIDLYLIHWSIPKMPKRIWQTLERVYREGRTRAIGISNYGIGDIEKLLEYAEVAPMANQVEFNPASYDPELLKYCQSKNIVVEAYSPLGRGALLCNSTVASIAGAHEKTPAQTLIRWALQHGTVPLPKSSSPGRIAANMQVFDFELSPGEMEAIDGLSMAKSSKRF